MIASPRSSASGVRRLTLTCSTGRLLLTIQRLLASLLLASLLLAYRRSDWISAPLNAAPPEDTPQLPKTAAILRGSLFILLVIKTRWTRTLTHQETITPLNHDTTLCQTSEQPGDPHQARACRSGHTINDLWPHQSIPQMAEDHHSLRK